MNREIERASVAMLILASIAQAQPDPLWSRTFGGGQFDEAYFLIQTADGGFALAGYTTSFDAGRGDFWLVKTDADGDSLWSRTFGGDMLDVCFSIIQTADGGFALAGSTTSFGVGGRDFWLVRCDADGDSLWSRTFGGENSDFCRTFIQTADGGFALAGSTTSFGAGDKDFWLVKTDENGDSLWSRTYGAENGELCYSLFQTADGGFALAGWTESFGAGDKDFWLVKTDADGDSLWSRTYGGESYEYCYSVIQTADSGFTLAGYTYSFGAGRVDFWLVKTDENGDSLWSRTFGGDRLDVCHSLIQTADGGFALAGYTGSFGVESADFWLVRTDADGDSLWSRTFGGDRLDVCHSLIQTADGGFALAGKTVSVRADDADFWLVKTGMDQLIWLPLPDTSLVQDDSLALNLGWFYDYISPRIEVDSLLSFEVVDGERVQGEIDGYELTITSEQDWFGLDSMMLIVSEARNEDNRDSAYLRLTVTPLSVDEDGYPLPAHFSLHSAYPNPFNSRTAIHFNLPQAGEARLALMDIQGREVARLLDAHMSPGSYSIDVDASDLAAGIYFAKLAASGQEASRKLVLVK